MPEEFELVHKRNIPLALFEKFARKYGRIENAEWFDDNRGNRYRFVFLGDLTVGDEACGSYGLAFRTWTTATTDNYEFLLLFAESEAELKDRVNQRVHLCQLQVSAHAHATDELEFNYADPGGCLTHPSYPLMRKIQDEARAMLKQLGLTISPEELDDDC